MIYGTSREYALKLILISYIRDGVELMMIASDYALGFLAMLWGFLEDAGFYLEMKGRRFIHWMRLYGVPAMHKAFRFCMAVAVWMSIEAVDKALAFRHELAAAWAFRQALVDEWKES